MTAAEFSVTQERIRQIEWRAIRKLRNIKIARDLRDYYYDTPSSYIDYYKIEGRD